MSGSFNRMYIEEEYNDILFQLAQHAVSMWPSGVCETDACNGFAGMQLMVHTLGGKVHTSSLGGEYGQMRIRTTQACQLYSYESDHSQLVWMSHGDSAEQLPEDFSVIATSEQVHFRSRPFRTISSCLSAYKLPAECSAISMLQQMHTGDASCMPFMICNDFCMGTKS